MHNTDTKILDLLDYLKYRKMVASDKDFCNKIEMINSTISKIKLGKAHFTVQHIETICQVFNVNANWIFGQETDMFLSENLNKIKDLTGNIADKVKR